MFRRIKLFFTRCKKVLPILQIFDHLIFGYFKYYCYQCERTSCFGPMHAFYFEVGDKSYFYPLLPITCNHCPAGVFLIDAEKALEVTKEFVELGTQRGHNVIP